MENIHNIKIGTDPEIFVKKDGEFVSAAGLIPGTKANPHKVNCGAVQVDGMALEFNTDPVDNIEDFNLNITTVMEQLQKMVPDHELVVSPTAEFSKEVLEAQSAETLELGCEPDFNSYDGGRPNPTPNSEGINFRTASGHLHIGWGEDFDVKDPDHIKACCSMTKILDYTLGVMSSVWDGDKKRRELYGNFGSFRPKPYGMEYRVLSNSWLNSPDTRNLVFMVAVGVFNHLVRYGDSITIANSDTRRLHSMSKNIISAISSGQDYIDYCYSFLGDDVVSLLKRIAGKHPISSFFELAQVRKFNVGFENV